MNDIRQWLTGLGLKRFGDAFEREELTTANLSELTEVELKDPLWLGLLRSIPTLIPIVFCAALSAQAADLEIEVRGIKVRTGQVHAGLFASAEDFSIDLAFRAMVTREGEIKIGVSRETICRGKSGRTVRPRANQRRSARRCGRVRCGQDAILRR